jgi:membrane protease YdiL (CAAX protease family)
MAEQSISPDWRAIHGAVFLACGVPLAVLPALRSWPWVWLAPLTGYAVVVALTPLLRRTFGWLQVGRFDRLSWTFAGAIIALSVGVLLGYHALVRPDVRALGAALPVHALGGVVMTGVVFAVLNATLEELVFRGILFDAIESQWGGWGAVAVTAAVFGLGHLGGYPPGPLGAVLAGLYGLGLGVLRLWVNGLALPVVVHITADATIYGILASEGAV